MKSKKLEEAADKKLEEAADKAVDLTGTVPVKDAAEYLGLTPRRVRVILDPDCNCAIRQRRARKKPIEDPTCPDCHGTLHTKNKEGQLINPPKDKDKERPTLDGIQDASDNWHVNVESLKKFARSNKKSGGQIQY